MLKMLETYWKYIENTLKVYRKYIEGCIQPSSAAVQLVKGVKSCGEKERSQRRENVTIGKHSILDP